MPSSSFCSTQRIQSKRPRCLFFALRIFFHTHTIYLAAVLCSAKLWLRYLSFFFLAAGLAGGINCEICGVGEVAVYFVCLFPF
ncbi:hypothetical protein BX070DRAFT_226034 [Coemansia spiralis]|nr:hypothetical protein BX070DRAFT_226034 [Coemansia spiralis]